MSELTLPRAGNRRWPFALGLIIDAPAGWAPGRDTVTAQQLAVVLACYRAGYFLLHTLRAAAPTEGGQVLGKPDRARLWGLARRTDADGLFVLGLDPPDVNLLEPLASELRLTLHAVPAPTGPIGLGPDPHTAEARPPRRSSWRSCRR